MGSVARGLTRFTSLLLRRVVAFARPHAGVFHTTQLDFDLPIPPIAGFVRRVIAEAVLGADFVRDLREGGARLLQGRSLEISAPAGAGQLVHLTARQVVELAADVHAFELPQLAEILIVFLI